MSKAERVVVTRFGGPHVLELREEDLPPLAKGQLLLRVRAAGVNFADIFAREGLYGPGPRAPFVPGFEVAGEVEAAGPDTPKPEGRVFAVSRFGGYSSRLVVQAARTYPIPRDWTFEEAAGFPGTYLTAWQGIANVARMRAGEKLLVHSAAGGVGIAAGQIARALEIEAIGTVGSPGKLEEARAAGYAHVFDYKARDFEAAVREVSPAGVDVVLDAIGGGGVFEKGYRLLRPGGRLLCYGLAGMTPRGVRPSYLRLALEWLRLPRFDPIRLIDDNKTVSGFQVLRLWEEEAVLQDSMKDLLALAEKGALRPRVSRTFPLAQAAAAHQLLHSGTTTGKLILTA
jgi:NADPH:quinone reductase-like Zn-dependent oxidoreductase